jgi:hypothetical protein
VWHVSTLEALDEIEQRLTNASARLKSETWQYAPKGSAVGSDCSGMGHLVPRSIHRLIREAHD